MLIFKVGFGGDFQYYKLVKAAEVLPEQKVVQKLGRSSMISFQYTLNRYLVWLGHNGESTVDLTLSSQDWSRINQFNVTFSLNVGIRESRYKILQRWYLTPVRI